METGFGKQVPADVLAQAIKGKRQAQHELYLVFAEPAYRLCLGMLGTTGLAEDAVQEAFIKAFKGLPSLTETRALGGWLKRICVHCALDLLAREKAGDTAELSLVLDDDDWRSAADSLTRLDDIERLLGILSQRERALVWLHVVEGHTFAELGVMLAMTETACRQACRRALGKLAHRARQWEKRDERKAAL
ncbi:sigma-70 family RNA polymerase sigma factor [Gallaecimonas sp. GXIMD4217]|uniref:RNA polymerase sigma factor n=1 Tax=Gallaecimonas sp. GXIMD4217 TaxID=3131927 RepID=UPI00311AE62F